MLAEMYLIAGAIFAVAFAARGVERIDSAAAGAGLGFRALIFPGAVAFWPLLLKRWWRAGL
jgi:hypothetical protein